MDRTKILIVEDEAVIAMYVQNSLAKLGYDVCATVNSGEEAVKKAAELRPDLVLMDIVLQGEMDGIQAAKIIHETLDIPVVYMTGNADVPTIQRARDTAPYGYVLKPVNVMHLFSTIDAILRRRDLEVRLAESEEKFRAISENMAEGVSLTVDYKNAWVNQSFADIFGYSPEEMIGRGADQVIHPDDLPELFRRAGELAKGNSKGYFRSRALRKGGEEIIIDAKGRLFRLGQTTAILLIVRDVTESVRTEAALKESEEKYRNLVEEINDVIFALDENGTVTFMSPRIENLTGFTVGEIQGRNAVELVYPEDRIKITGSLSERVSAGPQDYDERRLVTKSGKPIWVQISGKPIIVDGVFKGVRCMLSNIDEKKQAAEALRESEERFRALVQNLQDVILVVDSTGIVRFENPATASLLGYEALGKNIFEVVHPDDIRSAINDFKEVIDRTNPHQPSMFRVRHKDGSWLFLEVLASNLLDDPIIGGMLIVCRDVTVRMKAEQALRESEGRFRALVQNLQEVILILDINGTVMFENPATAAVLGESLLGKIAFSAVHPDNVDKSKRAFREVVDRINDDSPIHISMRHADGSWLNMEVVGVNLFDDPGIRGMLVVCRNITQRVKAQQALRDSEERYRALFDQSPVGVIHFNTSLVITDCNERLAKIIQTNRENLIGFDLKLLPVQIGLDKLKETLEGKTGFYEGSYQSVLSGMTIAVSVNMSPVRDENGKVIGGMAVVMDITDRRMAEEHLKQSEERNRLLVENANEGIAVIQEGRFVFANPRMIELTGFSAGELSSRRFTEYIHPDDREMISSRYNKRMDGDTTPFTYDVRIIDKAGVTRWTEINSILFDWEGKAAVLMFMRDISDRKQAEEERRKIEDQIQQTQKLESLGVLAGGIAHDFNNLLMAILGSIDLALLDLSTSSPVRGNLMEAAKASQRAADLCRQMLAYSGKGRFTSEAISLNELIEDMGHILEVSVSKKAIIRQRLTKGIPAIEADATQIRQIVMNLVINASDAIGEKSGVISITTGAMECDRAYLSETWLDEGLPEGLYVYIEVADTGIGMSPETLPKVFDPFFTTKFAGRGLGLAAVLGIVRGHRGAVKIYSEPGKGTTFKILFPAAERPAGPLDESRKGAQGWRGSGTVILADDEETIRAIGKQMLERLGFTVRTASNGREAVDLFRELGGRVTCVILDMTMPHMDGEETFRELRRISKKVRVVMSSGYNEQEVTRRFVGKRLAGFIQKPYQLADLAAKLKDILG